MEKKEYTRWQRFQNWFYYNKWYVAIAAIVLYVVGTMLWNVWSRVEPDFTISYVGSRQLPEACVQALEQALASLAEDANGDGQVIVKLKQHITVSNTNPENGMQGYAAEVTILADITQKESCFFLMEDPDTFQRNFWALSHLDGSIPAEDDFSGKDKVKAWTHCPTLSGLELGNYTDSYLDQTESGQCQQLLEKLYIGRRFYYEDYDPAIDRLWDIFTKEA